MRRLLVFTLGLALLASAGLAAGCGSGDGASSGGTAATVGGSASLSPAPDFSGGTLDGDQVSLASYSGKPLVLIFWGSW